MRLLTKIEIITVIAFLGLIVYGFFVLNDLGEDGLQCLGSPLKYGVDKLSKGIDYSVQCTCYVGKPGSLPIFIDSNT